MEFIRDQACKAPFEKIINPLTLFPLRYLGPLYHFGVCGEGGGVKLPSLVLSKSTCPIHFKLGKYLSHHNYFQNKSKQYPSSRDFLMTSSYFVKFSDILMKLQFEITFDVKNYFLLLLRFLKEILVCQNHKNFVII